MITFTPFPFAASPPGALTHLSVKPYCFIILRSASKIKPSAIFFSLLSPPGGHFSPKCRPDGRAPAVFPPAAGNFFPGGNNFHAVAHARNKKSKERGHMGTVVKRAVRRAGVKKP
ncbi:hypothetical protein [Anaerotruncus massiliensis (ex Liu et al. 2021)]|uniref:hypothetical protein n=1 Tax=Anaerotruncus massiliensis (ex Liu et al. 2021) TaxID=2321404 RepID=UPI003AB525F9